MPLAYRAIAGRILATCCVVLFMAAHVQADHVTAEPTPSDAFAKLKAAAGEGEWKTVYEGFTDEMQIRAVGRLAIWSTLNLGFNPFELEKYEKLPHEKQLAKNQQAEKQLRQICERHSVDLSQPGYKAFVLDKIVEGETNMTFADVARGAGKKVENPSGYFIAMMAWAAEHRGKTDRGPFFLSFDIGDFQIEDDVATASTKGSDAPSKVVMQKIENQWKISAINRRQKDDESTGDSAK